MSGSLIPAALTALTATWSGVVAGLQVSDGPIFDPDVTCLAVGWAGKSDAPVPGVVADRVQADAGRSRDAESIEVTSILAWHVGDPADLVACRTALFAAWTVLAAALAADPKLGGVVARAYVASYDLEQDITVTGSWLYLRPVVRIDGWK